MESIWAPSILRTNSPPPDRRQLEFEKVCVRRVLRAFGLSGRERELVDDFDKGWGKRWLTFESFFRAFPTFPIMLTAQSFYRTTAAEPLMRLSSLIYGFAGTFIWDRYCLLLDQYRTICARPGFADPLPPSLHGLPLGMVFNYDGIKGGLILHNGEPLTGSGLYFNASVQTSGRSPESIRCRVEPFGGWLAALAARGWSPDRPLNPLAVEEAPPLPDQERVNPLLPWAVRALGMGPAAALLSWLYHATHADPAAHPEATAFCCYRDGRRRVVASHAGIGFVLRLTEKQVKSAVARLRAERFIHADRGRNEYGVRTVFTLDDARCLRAQTADDEALAFDETWPAELMPFGTEWCVGLHPDRAELTTAGRTVRPACSPDLQPDRGQHHVEEHRDAYRPPARAGQIRRPPAGLAGRGPPAARPAGRAGRRADRADHARHRPGRQPGHGHPVPRLLCGPPPADGAVLLRDQLRGRVGRRRGGGGRPR